MSTQVEATMLNGAATVLVVAKMDASLAYYRDVLGFSVEFQWGMPTFYACLCRDEVSVHLLAANKTKRLPGEGAVCIFVNDVDAVHAEISTKGARVVKPPADYDYGMRDFDVLDLDGNQLIFGMSSQKAASTDVV